MTARVCWLLPPGVEDVPGHVWCGRWIRTLLAPAPARETPEDRLVESSSALLSRSTCRECAIRALCFYSIRAAAISARLKDPAVVA